MMDQIGRGPKFKVNRQRTKEEISFRLRVNKPLPATVKPKPFLNVVKMNSTYLELVDRCYHWRGFYTMIGLFLCGGCLIFFLVLVEAAPDAELAHAKRIQLAIAQGETPDPGWPMSTHLMVVALMLFPVFLGGLWFLKCELFNLTHNPIRFNRKNRTVYVTLYNRKVVSAPWDKIFFTPGAGYGMSTTEDLRGHIMGDKGQTIMHTFGLEVAYNPYSLWVFIREYMEKGPEQLVDKITYCLPIEREKENSLWAWHYVSSWAGPVFAVLCFPLVIPAWLCRLLAFHTCRIPKWPDWVEKDCQIFPGDPFIRDAGGNPPLDMGFPFDKKDLYRE